MVSLSFYPIDVDYVVDASGKPQIRLFGRSEGGKTICVYDDSFKPYFWVMPREGDDIEALRQQIQHIRVKQAQITGYATGVDVEEKRYRGKTVSLLKVMTNIPKAVPLLKEELENLPGVDMCLEADIPFYRRYLIDRGIAPLELLHVEGDIVDEPVTTDIVLRATSLSPDPTIVLNEPRILSFDIEVASPNRFPHEEKDPIIMVAFYGQAYCKVLCVKNFDDAPPYVEFVDNEGELLLRFVELVKEYNPDYLAGYFSDGFDFPYLRARASKYKIKLDLGRDGSSVKFGRGRSSSTARIVGMAHVDIFKFIRRVMSGQIALEAYDLDTVARHILGEGKKKDVTIGNLDADIKKGGSLKSYCEYNLQDAKVTYEITLKMLPNLHEFVRLIGLPVDDICRMSYGSFVEYYLLRNVKSFREVAPNKPAYKELKKREQESYTGAFVYEPVPGLHRDLVVFDFRSLYPTIISAHNICVSTITTETEGSVPSPEIKRGRGVICHYFTHRREGFIPVILKEILERRNRIKDIINREGKKNDPLLNARQYSLKILANSFYGYFGFSGARWYSNDCAEAITAYGRYYMKSVMDEAKKQGFGIIYGDTDSGFFSLNGKDKQDVRSFLEGINSHLPSLMELEYQGFYPRGLFVMKKGEERGAKKKYALLTEDGKVDVTGFEMVRGDWSKIAKEVQRKVFDIVLIDQDVKKAEQYVKRVIRDLQEGKVPLEKVVIRKQLRKDISDYESVGPHVEVAKAMKERGEVVSVGSIISYVIDKGEGKLRDKARLPGESTGYDPVYYIENQILPAVEKIFEVLGVDVKEFVPREQKKLGEFS